MSRRATGRALAPSPAPSSAVIPALAIVVCAWLACCGSSAAVASPLGPAPVVSLQDGQTRWFLGGQLQAGQTVRCASAKIAVEAKVPAAADSAVTSREVARNDDRISIEIERRADGAARIACGVATRNEPRHATLPYVIGQNGVGLIRGPNTLAALRRVFGREGSQRRTGNCVALWPAIGLRVSFATAACGNAAVSALATGSKWSSLDGTHVGDPVAEMRWLQPGARLVSAGRGESRWLLGRAQKPGTSRLYAIVTAGGRVAGFAFSAQG